MVEGMLPPATVKEALRQIVEQIPNYSLDSYYGQMGVDGDEMLEEIENEIWETEGNIAGLIKNGSLTLYREISAPVDWDYRLETRPHDYWSYDIEAAHAHWASDGADDIRWLITATISANQVDWVRTLVQGGNVMLSSEKEVCLQQGVRPDIIDVRPRDASHVSNF